MAPSADPRLEDLCRLALSAAARKGHELGDWIEDPAPADDARRATCRRCGRTINVRLGEGMTGIAGAALAELCD